MSQQPEPKVEIVVRNEISFQKPTMIIGLTGPGAVGSIAAQHIIESLKMNEIASVCSPLIPSVTIFLDGHLRQPFRIYGEETGKIIVSLCEIPLPDEISYFIAKSLMHWADSKGVSDIVILDAIPVEVKTTKNVVYGAAEPHILDRLMKHNIEPLHRGIISGLRAAILNQCLELNLDGMIFLSQSVPKIPDPLAASNLIQKLNEIYGYNIKTDELLQKQKEIEVKLKEITENVAKMEENRIISPSRYLA